MTDVVVELEVNEAGETIACAKISTSEWELNIRAPVSDFARLDRIRTADWHARASLAVGESAGAQVFWAAKGDSASILVGRDDETWDFSVTVPLAVVDEVTSLVAQLA